MFYRRRPLEALVWPEARSRVGVGVGAAEGAGSCVKSCVYHDLIRPSLAGGAAGGHVTIWQPNRRLHTNRDGRRILRDVHCLISDLGSSKTEVCGDVHCTQHAASATASLFESLKVGNQIPRFNEDGDVEEDARFLKSSCPLPPPREIGKGKITSSIV